MAHGCEMKTDLNVQIDATTRMASRQSGPLYQTKLYHNQVKHRLYERFTKPGTRLIDIGCGKGGDLHKWEHLRLRTVLAVDVNPSYIQEAKKRHSSKRAMRTQVVFVHADAFTEAFAPRDGRPYDAMSCMFCLHYASRDESSIHRAFQNASAALRPGGVFFGVCADGDAITAGGDVANDLTRIKLHQLDHPHPWGCSYEFSLCDSIVSEQNVEFVTRASDLVQVAAQHGMLPVPLEDCVDWRTSDGRPFPNLIGTSAQSADERAVSAMYFAFAFRKS